MRKVGRRRRYVDPFDFVGTTLILLITTDQTIPTSTPTTRPRNAVIHTFETPPPINIRPTPRPNSTIHTATPRLFLTIYTEPQFTITFPLSACCFIFKCTDVANTNHSIRRV